MPATKKAMKVIVEMGEDKAQTNPLDWVSTQKAKLIDLPQTGGSSEVAAKAFKSNNGSFANNKTLSRTPNQSGFYIRKTPLSVTYTLEKQELFAEEKCLLFSRKCYTPFER